jgi:hypothetical protein
VKIKYIMDNAEIAKYRIAGAQMFMFMFIFIFFDYIFFGFDSGLLFYPIPVICLVTNHIGIVMRESERER